MMRFANFPATSSTAFSIGILSVADPVHSPCAEVLSRIYWPSSGVTRDAPCDNNRISGFIFITSLNASWLLSAVSFNVYGVSKPISPPFVVPA